MKATIPLGHYRGIPVGAHWSVLLTVALLADLLAVNILPAAVPDATTTAYWVTALAVTVLFVASLLAHELAHAVLAHRFGVRVRSITLWMLGGAAVFEDEPPTPRADALVAGIGPVVSAGLSAMFLAAAVAISPTGLAGLPTAGLTWLAVANLLLAVFNLIPAAPLDGGRLLRAWLWLRSGNRDRAASTAAAVGQAFGVALIALGAVELVVWGALGGLWLAIVGWFVASAAAAERDQVTVLSGLSGITAGNVATPHPTVAAGWFTVEAFLDQLIEENVRHRVFPVVDFAGTPVGVISLHDLLRAQPDTTRSTRVQDLARPLDNSSVTYAGEPVTTLLRRAPLRPGQDAVLVLHNHRLDGIITVTDITRAVELAQLGKQPGKPAGAGRSATGARGTPLRPAT